MKINLICENCQNSFERRSSYQEFLNKTRKLKSTFCSRKCFGESKRKAKRKMLDIPDIINMYVNQFLGTTTISRKYKVCQQVIEDVLKENQIVLRDKTWVLINRPPFKDHKFSQEEKEIIRQKSLKAYENDPTLKDRLRQKTLEKISQGKMPKANTSIEKIIANLLTDLGISFEYQKIFGFWCFDFYLPKHDLFIECDGDYWHGHPNKYKEEDLNETQKNNIWRGKGKETYVKKRGHKLVRFWETDINNNLQEIKKYLCNL